MIRIHKTHKILFILTAVSLALLPVTPANAQVQAVGAPADPDSAEMIAMEGALSSSTSQGSVSAVSHEATLTDKKATIVEFQGKARIRSKGSTTWNEVTKGMTIHEGDELLTGKNGFIDLTYDSRLLNVARIDANTVALFQSIEPTVLKLQDGTIFNALDGLAPGSSYKISTDTAVAAVRGTHFGVVAQNGNFLDVAVTVDTKPHISRVEVFDLKRQETFDVVEDKQLTFQGDKPQIIPVTKEMKEIAGAVVDRIETFKDNLPQLEDKMFQEQDTNKKNSEDKQVPLNKDENRKFGNDGNPPNDGNHGSGKGSNTIGTDGPLAREGKLPASPDTSIDAMMDLLIPPDDLAEFETTPETSRELGRDLGSDSEETHEGLTEPKPLRADAAAVSKFFGVGMGLEQFTGEGMGTHEEVGLMAERIMENFGYEPNFAKEFGTFVEKYSENSGQLTNIGKMHRSTNDLKIPMTDSPLQMDQRKQQQNRETYTPDIKINHEIDSKSFTIDDALRDTTTFQNEIMNQTNGNPFESRVRDVLMFDLKLSEKNMLLTNMVTEIARSSAVEGNIVGTQTSPDEKIFGVKYFKTAGDAISAHYDRIENDTGSIIVQPANTGQGALPHIVNNILACGNTSDLESGCPS